MYMLSLLVASLAYGYEDSGEEYTSKASGLERLLYRRMQDQEAMVEAMRAAPPKSKKKGLPPQVYKIPGPQEPLPGRSHDSDYWPVYPFQNQYSGGLDLDPSISRHIGGDLNLAIPSWGILDIYGRYFNRIRDTTTKFGYLNHPVNMMDLEKEDLVELMSDPSAAWNREQQPTLPLGKLARSYVPISCKPPLCNPYHMNFGLGIEHDYGGHDGIEGDIDVPVPISKGIAYRMPISGKLYYAYDNITVSYGHNLAPIDPFASLFDYQKYRDPGLAIPRRTEPWRRSKRSVDYGPKRVWDLDGVDSNEVDVEDPSNPGKKTWKNFDIDPQATVTMSRKDFYNRLRNQAYAAQLNQARIDHVMRSQRNLNRQALVAQQYLQAARLRQAYAYHKRRQLQLYMNRMLNNYRWRQYYRQAQQQAVRAQMMAEFQRNKMRKNDNKISLNRRGQEQNPMDEMEKRTKRSVNDGPKRVWDLDGIDSNEVDVEDPSNSGKKTWKNFDIDPQATVTMSRKEFFERLSNPNPDPEIKRAYETMLYQEQARRAYDYQRQLYLNRARQHQWYQYLGQAQLYQKMHEYQLARQRQEYYRQLQRQAMIRNRLMHDYRALAAEQMYYGRQQQTMGSAPYPTPQSYLQHNSYLYNNRLPYTSYIRARPAMYV